MESQIKEKTEAGSGKFETIYIELYIRMGTFREDLAAEFGTVGYDDFEKGKYQSKISLTNLPELISLLDPPGGMVRGTESRPTTRFGFREDLYELISEASSKAFGMPTEIEMVARDGVVTFAAPVQPDVSGEPSAEKGEEMGSMEEAIDRIRGEI